METACRWVWIGNDWDKDEDTCVDPAKCLKPTQAGSYIGQEADVGCQVE